MAATSTTLFFTHGSSDKEYRASIEPSGDGWMVNFAFGRRGSALKAGTKTQSPVSLDKAKAIYDKLLREKIAKGYTEAESGMRYAGTSLAGRDSGLLPQLPSPMAPGDLEWLLNAPDWVAQEKFDGENRIVKISDTVQGINRKGLYVPVPKYWQDTRAVSTDAVTIVCGEDMGEYLAAFDLIQLDGVDLRQAPYPERHKALCEFAAQAMIGWVKVARYAATPGTKRAMLASVEADDGEGIVFKQSSSAFTEGRSTLALKHKFQESSTFIVTEVNNQRSVRLGLINAAGTVEDLGNVTIPANHDIPAVETLVEVQYMYRYEAGALMQPKYKGQRYDIDRSDCTTSQISRIKAKLAA